MSNALADRLCVNAFSLAHLSLADQLVALDAMQAPNAGLTITSCQTHGWAEAKELIAQANVKVQYLCHGVMSRADDPEGWAREIDYIKAAVDFAADAEIPIIYFTTGKLGELVFEEAAELVQGYLKPLMQYAAAAGVAIALENTMATRGDISFTHSMRDTNIIAQAVGAKLCVDFYNCYSEAGLMQLLRDNLQEVAIVQFADVRVGDLQLPNRRVPGDGDIPVDKLLRLVLEMGYEGLLDIELIGHEIDREGREQAVSRALDWLRAAVEA